MIIKDTCVCGGQFEVNDTCRAIPADGLGLKIDDVYRAWIKRHEDCEPRGSGFPPKEFFDALDRVSSIRDDS